ncbi:MAG TPA: hypothetical protein VF581_10185 [Flavobacterium sp.]|jgi:hypothetical protein
MATDDNSRKDLGDKKIFGEQHFEQHRDFNEGFSAENLPKDYNPSQLKSETVTDEQGNEKTVERARHTELDPNADAAKTADESADNQIIEKGDSPQNRDRNYDTEADRYPASHPDNHVHRGNMNVEE